MVRSVTVVLEVFLGYADLLAEDVRQPVASRIIDQRAAVGVDIFKSDPGRGKVPERIRRHVNRIRVQALLRPLVGRDGLKRFRLPLHQQADVTQQLRMLQNPAERTDFLMRIQIAAGVGGRCLRRARLAT